MKIKESDYNTLKAAAQKVQKNSPEITPETYKTNKVGKDTNKRFRWDLYWSALKNLRGTNQNEFVSRIYKYADDSHIDTALKKIVKELY